MNADEVETNLLNLSEAHPDFMELIELPNRTWQIAYVELYVFMLAKIATPECLSQEVCMQGSGEVLIFA
jgi:hypothetical protein